jgi:hypothetical protein
MFMVVSGVALAAYMHPGNITDAFYNLFMPGVHEP